MSDLQGKISCLEAELSRLAVQANLLAKYSDGLFSAGSKAHTSDLLDEITIGELGILGSAVRIDVKVYGVGSQEFIPP